MKENRNSEFFVTEEYQKFEAEEFKGLEILSQKMEVFQVDEISKNKAGEKKSKKDSSQSFKEKLKSKFSSSNSISVASSVGSATAIIAAGAIGVMIITTPLFDDLRLPIIESINLNHFITYNDDNTCNLYATYQIDETDNIYMEMSVYKDDTLLEYVSSFNQGYLSIENIKEDNFDVIVDTFYIHNDEMHLLNQTKIEDITPYFLSYQLSATQDILYFSIDNEISDNIVIDVIYQSDNTSSQILINKEDYYENMEIKLDKIDESISLNLKGSILTYTEIDISNIDYIGSFSYNFDIYENIKVNTTSIIDLTLIEVTNDSFYYLHDSSPTRLYFDGYLKPEDNLKINVYDSSNTLFTTLDSIESIHSCIDIYGLDLSADYTFEYIVYNKQTNETLAINSLQASLARPSDLNSVPAIDYNYLNPGDAFITINENNTFNIYLDLNYVHESEYDVYYRVDLLDEGIIKHSIASTEFGVCFEDVESSYYGLMYSSFVRNGLVAYALEDCIIPSGTIETYLQEDGTLNVYSSVYSIATKTYQFDCYREIRSDVELEIILDNNQVVNLTIKKENVDSSLSSSSFEFSLQEYEYSNIEVTIVCQMALNLYSSESIVNKFDNYKGSETATFKTTISL